MSYLDGAASVVGRQRTGAYGFRDFITNAKADGHATWLWLCGSAPTGAEVARGWPHLYQWNSGQIHPGGLEADLDWAYPGVLDALATAAPPLVPTPAPSQVPPWPLPPRHYFGLITGPAASHGGYYPADRPWVQQIQQALIRKGFVPASPTRIPAGPTASTKGPPARQCCGSRAQSATPNLHHRAKRLDPPAPEATAGHGLRLEVTRSEQRVITIFNSTYPYVARQVYLSNPSTGAVLTSAPIDYWHYLPAHRVCPERPARPRAADLFDDGRMLPHLHTYVQAYACWPRCHRRTAHTPRIRTRSYRPPTASIANLLRFRELHITS